MKMFKKLMAVVLTGALAVSMLTGCAMGDAMAESAMKSELNRLGKTNKIETIKHRRALQSVDFYGILICRKGAVSSNAGGYAPHQLSYIVLWNGMSMGGRFLEFSSRCSLSKGGMPHDSC